MSPRRVAGDTGGLLMDDRSSRCAECARPLAHDQRYCLRCGARRGPLPARIGLTIGEILERGRALPASGAELSAPRPRRTAARRRPPRGGGSLGGGGDPADARLRVRRRVADDAGRRCGPGPPAGGRGHAPAAGTRAERRGGVEHRERQRAHSGSSGPAPAAVATPAPAPAAAPQQTVTVGSPTLPTSATTPSTNTTPTGILGLPPIKHVWEIVLSEPGLQAGVRHQHGAPVPVEPAAAPG